MAEFKDRLEEALKMRDIKPAELARMTGIGEGAISQYRKGAYKATQRNLERMAQVLGVSIPWLMGVSDTIKDTSVSKASNAEIEKMYLRLARGAQELGLDEVDIDNILNLYSNHKKKNEN